LILICGLVITAYSIEWKAWKNNKLRNCGLTGLFILALIFGWLDIKDQDKKDDVAKGIALHSECTIDSANKELLASRKDYKILQDTLNNVINILRKNKIDFNFREKDIFIGAGFYTLHPDPEIKREVQAIENEQRITDRNSKLKKYQLELKTAQNLLVADSLNRKKNGSTPAIYKMTTGYMQQDRKHIKQYTDSITKYRE
jgi:hypothetical protein